MDFLRRQAFFIICAIAGAAGIALGVTGIKATSKVEEKMKEPAELYRNLNGLRSPGANRAMIEAEHERIDLVKEDRNKVVESASKLREYKPLVDGVFPDGSPLKLLEFRRVYGQQMLKSLDSLKYGGPASPRDIELMRGIIEEEGAEAEEFGLDDSEASSNALEGPPQTVAGVLTKAGVRADPVARAHIAAAQRIQCYAVHFSQARLPDRPASLEFDPNMEDVTSADPPILEEAWSAQIGYWIQRDVVDVIAAMNNEAADAALQARRDAWVGIMPVKEVISLRLTPEYITVDSEGMGPDSPGGYTAAEPPGGPDQVFTGRASGPDYEVMQFTVKLIMDQRDIPDFVNRLSKNSFYTLLGMSYTAVSPNRRMVGKIYGDEPAVNVVMDFEALMLGDVFRQWMPQEVCDYYEINCPVREEAEDEVGD